MNDRIERFLTSPVFGVVGASKNRDKYGNKILRCYLMNDRTAIPVNRTEQEIEGIACVATVTDLPEEVESISIITPPAVTEQVVEAAIARGIRHIWMQPGAESARAVELCRAHGINVIADGSCLLVVLRYREAH